MSYVPRLATKAREGLAALDSGLQEIVLDEIERLVKDPGLFTFRGTSESAVHDFLRTVGGVTYYVFITASRDDAAGVLHIESIGHYCRPD